MCNKRSTWLFVPLIYGKYENNYHSEFSGQMAMWISVVSLIVAITALGWNIYREFMKPKLRVRFFFAFNIRENGTNTPVNLIISVTNLGPGKIMITDNAILKARWAFFKKIFKKEYFKLLPITSKKEEIQRIIHPGAIILSSHLEPQKGFDRGEKEYFHIDYEKDDFLKNRAFIKIGLIDSFDRIHWAPKKDYKRVKRLYEEMPKN